MNSLTQAQPSTKTPHQNRGLSTARSTGLPARKSSSSVTGAKKAQSASTMAIKSAWL